MQQRYYDPELGMFPSTDPVTAYSDPVGAFNRYRYANSNPYRFIDPDGRDGCEFFGLCGPPEATKDPAMARADAIIGHDGRIVVGWWAVSSGAGALTAAAPEAAIAARTYVKPKTVGEIIICVLSLGDCRGKALNPVNPRQEAQRAEDAKRAAEALQRWLEGQLRRNPTEIPTPKPNPSLPKPNPEPLPPNPNPNPNPLPKPDPKPVESLN